MNWLRDRWALILAVGTLVPVLMLLVFWDMIRPQWPLWLACYGVALPAALFIAWTRHRGREAWNRRTSGQRMLLRGATILLVWVLFIGLERGASDRIADATAMAVVVAVFWGGYLMFSRGIDEFWSRIRK